MRTDSKSNISLLLPMQTLIVGQNRWTDADSKFWDPHISGQHFCSN